MPENRLPQRDDPGRETAGAVDLGGAAAARIRRRRRGMQTDPPDGPLVERVTGLDRPDMLRHRQAQVAAARFNIAADSSTSAAAATRSSCANRYAVTVLSSMIWSVPAGPSMRTRSVISSWPP